MQDENDKNQVHLPNQRGQTGGDTARYHTWLVRRIFLRSAGCLALKLIEKVAVGQDSIMRYKQASTHTHTHTLRPKSWRPGK